MTDRPEWEPIARSLDRVRVPGGWLYRVMIGGSQATGIAMVFVPEPADPRQPNSRELIHR